MRGRLMLLAVACAIISLMAIFMVTPDFSGSAIDRWYAVVIATITGGLIGLAQAPIVAWALAHKRLAVVVPSLYVAASIVSFVVMASQRQPVWSIFTFTLIVPLLAVLARFLPNRQFPAGAYCYMCGYNLSGGTEGVCPECGAPQIVPLPPSSSTGATTT